MSDSKGRYQRQAEEFTAADLASEELGATENGTAFDTTDLIALYATVTVTAVSGTDPTLDLILQTSVDGTNYYTVGQFTQVTGTGTEAKAFGPLGPTSRWRKVIGGTSTPTVTFSVDATVNRDD